MELPEENELVLATIKKIMPYGAVCSLTEYGEAEAFLHISEVAPRWIKNIHEFISEGQRVVAKVHRLDKEKRQIDISLKRVNDEEKRRKLEQVNFEKRADRLIEVALTAAKLKKPTVQEVKDTILEEYGDVYTLLKEVSEKGEESLEKFKFPKIFITKLVEVAKKNIKKPVVTIGGTVKLTCHGGHGVALIREAFADPSKSMKVLYLGAPRYKIMLTSSDYKTGEKKLADWVGKIEEFAKKNSCTFEFKREDE
ncbi:MAG: S1 RNA-binding domain-containing protein [Candidatus Micrarchaeota archaeon]